MKKDNATLNTEWCDHARWFLKKKTSKRRRLRDKKIIRQMLREMPS